MLPYVLQGFGFSAAVQPGPLQTYAIGHTLDRGWRSTLPVALAPLLSDGPIILLACLGIHQLRRGLVSRLAS